MASLPPSPFSFVDEPSAETLVVVPGPQASVAAASGPFNSDASVALTSDEAAALVGSHAPGAAADICEPTSSTGGPQESPAPGKELCGAGDLECIGEIFVGARKMFDPDPAGYRNADQVYYDLLKAIDNPNERDLPEIPAGLWAELEPLPLFLQQARA